MENRNQQIMSTAVLAGELLLGNGAEVARVQDTIERIFVAMKVENWNVFVISNGIFATIDEMGKEPCSAVRHIPLGAIDLCKIITVNQISREICSGNCSLEQAMERLEKCKEQKGPSKRLQIIAAASGCAGFSWMFGGRMQEFILAFFMGIGIQIFLLIAGRNHLSTLLTDILGGILIILMAQPFVLVGVLPNVDNAVIGTLMILVPGVAFTTGIRDLFAGDYLSGSIHVMHAVMKAVCIAIGVGAGILLMQFMGGFV
jgi:uncharacterized membrane protein YjjP (DUF1212 family)